MWLGGGGRAIADRIEQDTIMPTAFPVVLSDIGGTNARFSVLRARTSPIEPLSHLKTHEFPSFADALRSAVGNAGVAPKTVLVCAAGPVEGAHVRLTNAQWTIDGREVARDLGLEQGLMFNDFEALALSIPSFKPEWLKTIGGVREPAGQTRIISGPGTGLGTAGLINVEGRWRAIASEGSHSDFAPVSDDEWRLWPHVEKREGRITPETLISGVGLRRLHRARLAAEKRARPEIDEAEIIERALADPAGEEGRSVKLFWRLVARYEGDLALTFLATGGVFLAGGILPRIVSLLDEKDFRDTFENKAPYQALARRIPVQLLIEEDVVLHGMAEIARNPEAYAIDHATRAWVA